jgi:antagonist of KipI
MALKVLKAGVLDTIQDMGRYGYSHWGINPGGAMDTYATAISNALVGNEAHLPVLEMHFPGPQLLFEKPALIALCGANMNPQAVNRPLPMWQPVLVQKNTVIYFDQKIWGERTYLAIHGGFKIEPWLNSFSTNLKAKAGGFEGRKLAKMDRIEFLSSPNKATLHINEEEEFKKLNWKVNPDYLFSDQLTFPVVAGQEWIQLEKDSRAAFLQGQFTVGKQSDRMGYRLSGVPLTSTRNDELLSTSVDTGTVQLLPDGQLIILMADRQTTGGYPRIAHIHHCGLPTLAQVASGTPIGFKITSLEEAEKYHIERQQEITLIRKSCLENLDKWMH